MARKGELWKEERSQKEVGVDFQGPGAGAVPHFIVWAWEWKTPTMVDLYEQTLV